MQSATTIATRSKGSDSRSKTTGRFEGSIRGGYPHSVGKRRYRIPRPLMPGASLKRVASPGLLGSPRQRTRNSMVRCLTRAPLADRRPAGRAHRRGPSDGAGPWAPHATAHQTHLPHPTASGAGGLSDRRLARVGRPRSLAGGTRGGTPVGGSCAGHGCRRIRRAKDLWGMHEITARRTAHSHVWASTSSTLGIRSAQRYPSLPAGARLDFGQRAEVDMAVATRRPVRWIRRRCQPATKREGR